MTDYGTDKVHRPAAEQHRWQIDVEAFGDIMRVFQANLDAQQAQAKAREKDELEQALEIWEQSRPLRGTLAERYLGARGIEVPKEARSVLRYHAGIPCRGGGTIPALVARLDFVVTGCPTAVQITGLAPDGTVLGVKVTGAASGGAIMLSPMTKVRGELAIGVGLETCLSARALGVDVPIWCLRNIGELSQFPVLPCLAMVAPELAGIERLTIIADNDVDCQKAAAKTRAQWEAHGLRVRVLTPRKALA